MLTIMYGFIVPDEVFDVFVADGSYSYWNGILDPVLVKGGRIAQSSDVCQ